jgi:hypothetical protein
MLMESKPFVVPSGKSTIFHETCSRDIILKSACVFIETLH